MKKKKEKFVDDGRVIANMDDPSINGYKSKKEHDKQRELRELDMSREERRAIYRAAFSQFMPVFGMFIASLLIVILLLYFFWMN